MIFFEGQGSKWVTATTARVISDSLFFIMKVKDVEISLKSSISKIADTKVDEKLSLGRQGVQRKRQ